MEAHQRVRDKFRGEIRARQVKEIMRMYRMQALGAEDTHANIFSELSRRVELSAQQAVSMDLVHELVSLLEEHPREQNSYVLVGNYLALHEGAHHYFMARMLGLCQLAYPLDNYLRCLFLLLVKAEQVTKQNLQQFDEALALIMKSTTSHLKLYELTNILNTLMTHENLAEELKFFPAQLIQELFSCIGRLDMDKIEGDFKYSLLTAMHILGDEHMDKPILRYNTLLFLHVIVPAMSEYPQFRPHFISYLKVIVVQNIDEVDKILRSGMGAQVVEEILYIFENVYTERINLLSIMECLVKQAQFDTFVWLLNQGLHLALLSAFGNPDPDVLQATLRLILLLLDRLRDRSEDQLLNRVLDSMENNQFELHLEHLAKQRQTPQVEKYLATLLDDYYSQEAENNQ